MYSTEIRYSIPIPNKNFPHPFSTPPALPLPYANTTLRSRTGGDRAATPFFYIVVFNQPAQYSQRGKSTPVREGGGGGELAKVRFRTRILERSLEV
jgi:hypothetical protein